MGEKHRGKGEFARYDQFILFPYCFQKISNVDTLKPGIVWERLKLVTSNLSFSHIVFKRLVDYYSHVKIRDCSGKG